MYCFHCGKEIDEKKALQMQPKGQVVDRSGVEDESAEESYICPRCGHLIRSATSEEDYKSLSRASHAQVQRGSNAFATGMWLVSVGVIIGIISFLFFLLSRRTKAGVTVIRTDQSQFWVFVILAIISVILLGFGIYYSVTGFKTRHKYLALLKDINNKTFVQ